MQKYSLNGLRVITFIVQNTISSNIDIASLCQNNYSKEYFDEVKQCCRYRLGILSKYFYIVNTKVMKSIDDNIVLNCLVLYSDFVISNLSELLIWRYRNIYNMRMIGY